MKSFLLKDKNYPDIMYRKVFLMEDETDGKYIYPREFNTMEEAELAPAVDGAEIGIFMIIKDSDGLKYRGFSIHQFESDQMPFGVCFSVIRMVNDYPENHGNKANLQSALYYIDCYISNIKI